MISSVIIAIRIIQPIHFLLVCFQTPIDLNRTGGHADIQKDPLITMIPAVYFSNNMAALMSKWHYPLAEASVWSHRSIEARRQLMYLDFAENAENYMQSLLNYAGLLCKYGAMDELASLYQEINTICDEINAQYPDAYGMLRPKGNRVNFGYVFQRASMRTKYAQSLAEKGKTMAGDSDCYEKAAGLYEESLTELRELLAFTGGEQMAVHEALSKRPYHCTASGNIPLISSKTPFWYNLQRLFSL